MDLKQEMFNQSFCQKGEEKKTCVFLCNKSQFIFECSKQDVTIILIYKLNEKKNWIFISNLLN